MTDIRDTSRILLGLAEAKEGVPVTVVEEPQLSTMAALRVARGESPSHFILYNPSCAAILDYLICFHSAMLLRDSPRSRRWDLAGTPRGRQEAERQFKVSLRETGGVELPADGIARLSGQFYDKLMVQLRSVPIGLRVDAWLLSNYPEVAYQQRKAVNKQLNENLGTLSPDVARLAPASVFQASVGMNAAFALYWARLNGEPGLPGPYFEKGFEEIATSLLDILERIPDQPIDDATLVEAWGERLGLHGWFRVVTPESA